MTGIDGDGRVKGNGVPVAHGQRRNFHILINDLCSGLEIGGSAYLSTLINHDSVRGDIGTCDERDCRKPFPVIGGEVVGVETVNDIALDTAVGASESYEVGVLVPCQRLLRDNLCGGSVPT